jgi:hypothetical protein
MKPEEGKNVHFRVAKCHIDFFIQEKVFVEYHPPMKIGVKKEETVQSYYEKRRGLLNQNGYESYPLLVIDRLKGIELKINKIKELLSFKTD